MYDEDTVLLLWLRHRAPAFKQVLLCCSQHPPHAAVPLFLLLHPLMNPAGPEAFAGLNLSSMQQPTFDGMPAGSLGNFSSMGLPSLGGMPTLPGLDNATEPEEQQPKKARSSAGSYAAGTLPLLVAAAAVLVL